MAMGSDVGTSSSKFFKALQDEVSTAVHGNGPKMEKKSAPVSKSSKLKL